jgi:hypothetical protein
VALLKTINLSKNQMKVVSLLLFVLIKETAPCPVAKSFQVMWHIKISTPAPLIKVSGSSFHLLPFGHQLPYRILT